MAKLWIREAPRLFVEIVRVLIRADFIISSFPWLFVNSIYVSARNEATEPIDESTSALLRSHRQVRMEVAIVARRDDKINGISTASPWFYR
jgi:hypothetical protein